MHTEATREEETKPRESLARRLRHAILGDTDEEYLRKLEEKMHACKMEFLAEIRRIANPNNKDLTLVYPASGWDIETPLRATGARTLILIDMSDHSQDIIWEIKKMGIEIKNISSSGNRTEIEFQWEGRDTRVLFYNLTIESHKLDELPKEVKDGYDIYFENKQMGIGYPAIQERFFNNLKIGGFRVADREIADNLGFKRILFGDKFENFLYDEVRMFVQEKTQQRPALEKLMIFNEDLSNADERRHGGLTGISETWADETLSDYFTQLIRLKKAFNDLPDELKKDVEPQVIDRLYNAPGDMSKIHHSPEHWMKLYKRDQARGRIVSEHDKNFFESEIKSAQHFKDRPTVEQLERYIERGRKIFKEVWEEN